MLTRRLFLLTPFLLLPALAAQPPAVPHPEKLAAIKSRMQQFVDIPRPDIALAPLVRGSAAVISPRARCREWAGPGSAGRRP